MTSKPNSTSPPTNTENLVELQELDDINTATKISSQEGTISNSVQNESLSIPESISFQSSLNTEQEDEILAQNSPTERDLLVFGLSYSDYSMEPDLMNQSERDSFLSACTNRDQGKQLFNHFNSITANVLRNIVARCGNGRIRNNKFRNVLAILHRIAKISKEGRKTAFETIRDDEILKPYISEEKLTYIESLPKIQTKKKDISAKNARYKKIVKSDGSQKQPSFSANEFARLVLLLRDDEDIRASMYEVSKGLNREALDLKFKSKDIWDTIIEKRFNDSDVKPVQFIPGLRVYPQNAPVCYREGSYLYSIYMRSKSSFSTYYQRWNRSGHRNTDPKWFEGFLTKNSDDELTTDSTRSYILFILLRIGMENEVSDLIAMVDKGMDVQEGIGYEEGCNDNENDGNNSTKRKNADTGCSSSKKSRSSGLTTAEILDAALSSEGAAERKLNLAKTASVTQEIEQRKINSMFENIKVFKQSKEMQSTEDDENVKKMLKNTCDSILKLHSNTNSD